jgi:hypothetical protein
VGMDEQVEQTGGAAHLGQRRRELELWHRPSHSHNSLYNIGPQHRQNTDMAAEPNEG